MGQAGRLEVQVRDDATVLSPKSAEKVSELETQNFHATVLKKTEFLLLQEPLVFVHRPSNDWIMWPTHYRKSSALLKVY